MALPYTNDRMQNMAMSFVTIHNMVGSGREVVGWDEEWKEVALKALVKTRSPIRGKGKKLEALLQFEKLQWMIDREAARTVRRWRAKAAEENGGKMTRMCQRALVQVERLRPLAPLKQALVRIGGGKEDDEAEEWTNRWNKEVRPTGD